MAIHITRVYECDGCKTQVPISHGKSDSMPEGWDRVHIATLLEIGKDHYEPRSLVRGDFCSACKDLLVNIYNNMVVESINGISRKKEAV